MYYIKVEVAAAVKCLFVDSSGALRNIDFLFLLNQIKMVNAIYFHLIW